MWFDGETYSPELDQKRLEKQIYRVWFAMSDGHWHTLSEIRTLTGGSEAAISARLRDYRKPRFGAHEVQRRRVSRGLWSYRVIPARSFTLDG